MISEYDEITAIHYSAFRPNLHSKILSECFDQQKKYSLGLDIGCGAGQSSIALAQYSKKVIGMEPSQPMLEKAIAHPKVAYIHSDCQQINFPKNNFDVITFAGSLYYAKSQKLLDEIVRVGKPFAKIIIYDFELLLNPVFQKLDIDTTAKVKSAYDHQVNFAGLKQDKIRIEKKTKNSVSLEVSNLELAHLLLSSKDNYEMLKKHFGHKNLHAELSHKLLSVYKTDLIELNANTYLTIYQLEE